MSKHKHSFNATAEKRKFFALPVKRDLSSAIYIEKIKGLIFPLSDYVLAMKSIIDLRDIIHVQEDDYSVLIFLKNKGLVDKIVKMYRAIRVNGLPALIKKAESANRLIIKVTANVPDELIAHILQIKCNVRLSDCQIGEILYNVHPELAHICFTHKEIMITDISLKKSILLVNIFSQDCEVLDVRLEFLMPKLSPTNAKEKNSVSSVSNKNLNPTSVQEVSTHGKTATKTPSVLVNEVFEYESTNEDTSVIQSNERNVSQEKVNIPKTMGQKNQPTVDNNKIKVKEISKTKSLDVKTSQVGTENVCEIKNNINEYEELNKFFDTAVNLNEKDFKFADFAAGLIHVLLDTTGRVSIMTKFKYIEVYEDVIAKLNVKAKHAMKS